MTTAYSIPHDIHNLSMANSEFLYDNLLGLNNDATADRMDDLLLNFDLTTFAVCEEDIDSELFGTASYNMPTGNPKQIEALWNTTAQWDHTMQTPLSSPDVCSASPSMTHGSSRRSSRSSSPISEARSQTIKPKRKRSAVVNKAAHNKVEKRYRSNINAKFAALNNILPLSETMQSLLESQEQADESVQQHRNKGEILSEALRYIKQLQDKSRVLEGEIRILKGNVLHRRRIK